MLIEENSTLTVSFSDSVVIRTGASSPEKNAKLAETLQSLNSRQLVRQDLYQFTRDEIGYLRNGVYALSGKIFQTQKYSQYFNAQSWYKGTSADDNTVSARFNKYQTDNLKLILAYEKELDRALVNVK